MQCFVKVIQLIIFCLPVVTLQANGRTISGKVADDKNRAIPFASVFVKGTTVGTTTNSEGFYKLNAGDSLMVVVVKHIGYKTAEQTVGPGKEDVNLNFRLQPESYSLTEVVVKAGEDPAYPVMRNAIERRKFYRYQINSYSCSAYIKGMQRLTAWPEKFLGQPVLVSAFIDTTTRIIYLSESVSEFYYLKPESYYEEMISSKVSGNSRGFSWNRARDMQFNFYDPLIKTDVAPRGLISPLAPSAFFYYRFRHEGTFVENQVLVHKIAVIPKRKNDPVFSGHIFIQEPAWRLHGIDLLVTRDAQLQFIDSLEIRQVFLPVSDDVWLPATLSFYFTFSIFGFEGNGRFVGSFSNYNLRPFLPSGLFKGTEMKVREESNKRDSAYWESIRPVPLTEIEKRDYAFKDSLQDVRQSKSFLDSIDRQTNKLTAAKIFLTGYEYRQRYKRLTYSFSSLLQNIQFNTVEGMTIGLNTVISKVTDTLLRNRFEINPYLQYNTSSHDLYATLRTSWFYNRKKSASCYLEGGRRSFQFNPANPISYSVNTYYTLFDRKNYMKLYLADYVKTGWKMEPFNGFYYDLNVYYQKRLPLFNTTDFSFAAKNKRDFTPNYPKVAGFEDFNLWPFHAFITQLKITLKPGQQYIDRPYSKIITGQKLPVVTLLFKKALPFSERYADFHFVSASLLHKLDAGLLGHTEFDVSAGKFLNNNRSGLPDFHHFFGNLTLFSSFRLNRFFLLDSYLRSTSDRFAELHAEHDFNGFILNKIPLLKKLKLTEHLSFHLLHTPGFDNHYEVSAGLSKLGIIRCDYAMAFGKNRAVEHAFRIALVGID